MSTDTPADFGRGPAAEVRRWLKELDLADKTEKEWRETGEKIWKRYRGTQRRKNSFNILWSNTETLAPALFNTPPAPDVRRRFRDEDPVGKAVSQLLERCLEFQTDTENFMACMKQDVLDACLPGRGVSRIKYVPEMAPMAGPEGEVVEAEQKEGQEPVEPDEQVAWEQCEVEHVQWDDFRHGPGKTWAQVQWVAFRHRMTRDELAELTSNAIAQQIALDKCQDETIDKDEQLKTVFGTAEVWEFWCKEYREVKYICKGYTKAPLKTIEDPLKLIDFFPNPRPLYAISDSSSLIPTPIFEQYKEQADELDRVSQRINLVVNAIKVRGIYDSTMAEMGQLMSTRVRDNDLIPMQNAAMWAEKGGLEKAIYWLPIIDMAAVLKVLYEQREQSKQIIYELSGIADVRRGTSDPNETLGAQKLKADFGNQRISGLKLEVERYVRDLMRLMAELVAEKFSPPTLLRMAQMQIPTTAEVEQKVAQTQQQAIQQAQQQGQDPQQAIAQAMQQLGPRPVTLEQVMEVLHDDATRMFKIDVETDSMVSATVNDDMQGLQQVLSGVVQFIDGVGPAVQAGAFPVEAVKEIVMTICRRSKMGSAVEDALDKIQAPKEQGDPEQAKAQAAQQAAQVKAQTDQQIAQMKVQSDAQIEQIRAQSKIQIEAAAQQAQQQTDIVRQQAEAEQHRMKLDNEAQIEALKARYADEKNMRDAQYEDARHQREMEFQHWKAELDAATKIEVANISSKAKVDNAATETATSEIAREVKP